MKQTDNLKIGYPELNDFISPDTFKDAFILIDGELKRLSGVIENIDITQQLQNYYTKTETDTAIQNAIDTEIMSVLEGDF